MLAQEVKLLSSLEKNGHPKMLNKVLDCYTQGADKVRALWKL